MLRVIGGESKGRRLSILKKKSVRPTADRVKEALFNILRDKIPEAKVLDLFAGVGNLGIEALSRGAEKVVFVDKEAACAGVIRKNLDSLGFLGRAEVYQGEVSKTAARLARRGEKFDLIFVDPPYGSVLAEKTLLSLADGCLISDRGTVVVEHHRKKVLPEETGKLELVRVKSYGETSLSFYLKSKSV